MKKLTFQFGLVLLLIVGIVGQVGAHSAVLLRSEPMAGARLAQPPDEVVVWFSEELVSANSHLTLYNSRGETVESGGVDLHDPQHASMTAVAPSLPEGIYTVYWQAALLDGDISEGTIIFMVGQPDPREAAFDPTAASTTSQSSQTAVFITIAIALVGGLAALFWRRRTT
ncbi:MAG: copper resistance protein CopC [Ardenticatenaceae bacterium]|nr:copper resistance protein CopC [Ardenticatenaceae bacterium]